MSQSPQGAVIACGGLGKSFDGEPVVRDLDLAIGAGAIVGFIGPSGCGKTTTVRLLTGLYEPTTGWAEVNGTPAARLTDGQRQQLGYLPQIPALFPELSLWENLSFHASMYGLRLRRRRRLREMLDWVELGAHRDKRVSEVSGGMQRRLALAASFVHDPPILFLDEPTAGIDPILRAKFWEHFRVLRDEGRTIFVTTQYVGEASFCDRVGLLSDGELLMLDTPENLRRAAFDGEVVDLELARRVDAAALRPLAGLDVVMGPPQEVEPRRWRVVVSDAGAAEEVIRTALEEAGLPVVEVEEHIVDYDEAFVRVIERHRAARVTPEGGVVRRRRRLRVRGPWATVIQCSAFVRKELAEIVRQPGLILLLIVGPFVLLMMFGVGYRSDDLGLRTLFVGPADSFYEQAIDDYEQQLERFVEPQGYTTDEAAALAGLEDGALDVVVVFPADPLGQVLDGERAPIEVWHDKIDPIQTTAVTIAAQLAVQEINATVLAAVVGGSQEALRPADDVLGALTSAAGALTGATAATDAAGVATNAGALGAAAGELRTLVAGSDLVLTRLGAVDEDGARASVLARLDDIVTRARSIEAGTGADAAAEADAIAADVGAVADVMPSISALDPDVLVRPFVSATASVVPVDIDPADFFAPSSLALLVQHLAVTIAALSLVRDRDLGLFELLRVGPLSSAEILAGKTVAYLVVGMVVGVGLLAAAVNFLGVPLAGEAGWAVAAIGLVLLSSLALGLLISLVSGSETQAVQWSMLSLLAGLFFGGFVLDLEGLQYPVKAVSWLLPVTYGIRSLQDVLLRGVPPAPVDLAGLGGLVVVYGTLAIVALRQQLRTA